jgi:GNAT superfamily N-acetyltransferase
MVYMKLLRTNSDNKDFIKLVKLLDSDLAIRDGEDHAFYAQFNKIDSIKHVVVAYHNETLLGCGAIKAYSNDTMEIKRMYTTTESRGKGVASKILAELETWTAELNYKICVLETGIKQPEAIALYKKNGYIIIPSYGQYVDVVDSTCFEKRVSK